MMGSTDTPPFQDGSTPLGKQQRLGKRVDRAMISNRLGKDLLHFSAGKLAQRKPNTNEGPAPVRITAWTSTFFAHSSRQYTISSRRAIDEALRFSGR
jgi:hypothetical protein